MRAVAIGLTLLMAARAPALHADPDAPQISPGRAQREDAQRLSEQLRGLEREPAPVPAAAPAAQPRAGRAEIDAQPRAVPAARKSVVREWWFWAAVGAAALTVIGVTLEATRGDGGGGSMPPLPGLTCDAAGCR
jgi:hypothetical protein